MFRPAEHFEVARPPLRGICQGVKGYEPRTDPPRPRSTTAAAITKFPRRPDARVLSESIPLFFITRNKAGLWVAREAEGRAGGIFLFKRSALRFAAKYSAPAGCATMFLSERLELDVESRGNPLIGWLDVVIRRVVRMAVSRSPAHDTSCTMAVAMAGQHRKRGKS